MNIFNILRDEDKLKIILILQDSEECVCKLEEILNLKQSTLSNKLRVLKNAQIIDVRKEKNWNYYRLNASFVQENQKLLEYIKDKSEWTFISEADC